MTNLLIDFLPDAFRTDTGDLNDIAIYVGLSIWAIVFLAIGLVFGRIFFRETRSALKTLKIENKRSRERLVIYESTVQKQERTY